MSRKYWGTIQVLELRVDLVAFCPFLYSGIGLGQHGKSQTSNATKPNVLSETAIVKLFNKGRALKTYYKLLLKLKIRCWCTQDLPKTQRLNPLT